MNSFRAQIFGTQSGEPQSLLGTKSPRGADAEAGIRSVAVPRAESRTADTRDSDRHRLPDEAVEAVHDGTSYEVQLINLSGGGAMISAAFDPNLWDRVDLNLGENGTIECAVRWIKEGRIGLEFAHETRLDCSAAERDGLLRRVLAANFPDVDIAPSVPPSEPAVRIEHDENRIASRHPLIWSGVVHYNHDSAPARLRNISSSGALVECSNPVPDGAELLLDLGEAGSLFATVSWTRGDQAGLRFHAPFDIGLLAKSRPQVAPAKWDQPAYLRTSGSSSPWEQQWGRQSLSELKEDLDGFLKR